METDESSQATYQPKSTDSKPLLQAVTVYSTSNQKERGVSDYWKALAMAFPTLDKVLRLV